jgi:hypothetical protein
MIRAIARAWDRFRGGGEAAVTVPPMDGALRPNTVLESSPFFLHMDAPDNLASDGRRILVSSGSEVLELGEKEGAAEAVSKERFGSSVSCLAAHAEGALAVGLEEGKVVIRGGRHGGFALDQLPDRELVCPVAVTFGNADTLFLCLGSQTTRPSEWKRDLMTKNASGSVWRIDLSTETAVCLSGDLAYPNGVVVSATNEILVSESWRHRLIVVEAQGAKRVVYDDMPGYPARLARDDESQDLWLAVFAPRTQLIELVLREPKYRERMMAEIDPEYWIAPSLHCPQSYLEPLQLGGLKQLGEMKPWAPSRSYGLVVRLDRNYQPIQSFHSRANGVRHGITSCVPMKERVLATSKGGNAIVAIDK